MHVQSHGAAVASGEEKREGILDTVVPPVHFSPKKTLKQASVEQLSQLQKCLEGGVVRGV